MAKNKTAADSYDFAGWATRNDLRCSDGRVIMKDAFKHNDGDVVPLVWNHCHSDPSNILGHARLENRSEGVYAYCSFNNTAKGRDALEMLRHGDITSLSIYANNIREQNRNVIHGAIREVSLVLAGANPGAYIEAVLAHGEGFPEDEAVIYTGEEIESMNGFLHSEEGWTEENQNEEKETVADVFNTLTDKQKNAVYGIVGMAASGLSDENKDENENGGDSVKHNIFDREETNGGGILKHSAIVFGGNAGEGGKEIIHSAMAAVIGDAKRYGSMKESFLQHAENYGIKDIEWLFPDSKSLNNPPAFIKRETGWVQKVMNAVHHTPFSRIKSVFADITADEARAKGYIKGNRKKEEVFTLLKRTTDPTTIYKKQKMDRDDVIDIVDFDVISWIKGEMRIMLNEEIARAVLLGDGRLASSDDKVDESKIRPIAYDDDLYTIKAVVPSSASSTVEQAASEFIKTAIRARKYYKGSGSPTLFTTEDVLTGCLLLEDGVGRPLYTDEAQLARKLRVKEIVTVPVMEDAKGKKGGTLLGVIVNLADYNVGADKGGAVSMFDDFDIDYNAQKYLIETRCSGALVVPYSAIAIEMSSTAAKEDDIGGDTD
ncbi:MAG: HK97 family phage prohead protease [Ruminococcus sp.]|nr:HK97 family phage prohead protease [Ruminococcus sp.]